MKVENATSPYVEPLYGKPSEIIFNKKNLVSRSQFVKKYGFCNRSLFPKYVKDREGLHRRGNASIIWALQHQKWLSLLF